MKKINFRLLVTFTVILSMCMMLPAMAQEKKKEVVKEKEMVKHEPHQKMDHAGLPGLTEDQKQKMKDIRMKSEKEIMPIKNQCEEKKAHLKTLTTADKPDQMEINKTIDEMMALKTSVMKIEVASKQDIRKILNDEQRVMFDKDCKKMEHKEMSKPPRSHGK